MVKNKRIREYAKYHQMLEYIGNKAYRHLGETIKGKFQTLIKTSKFKEVNNNRIKKKFYML